MHPDVRGDAVEAENAASSVGLVTACSPGNSLIPQTTAVQVQARKPRRFASWPESARAPAGSRRPRRGSPPVGRLIDRKVGAAADLPIGGMQEIALDEVIGDPLQCLGRDRAGIEQRRWRVQLAGWISTQSWLAHISAKRSRSLFAACKNPRPARAPGRGRRHTNTSQDPRHRGHTRQRPRSCGPSPADRPHPARPRGGRAAGHAQKARLCTPH